MCPYAPLFVVFFILLGFVTGIWTRTGEASYLVCLVAGHAVGIPLFGIGVYLAGRFGTFNGFKRRQWLAAAPVAYLGGFSIGLLLLTLCSI